QDRGRTEAGAMTTAVLVLTFVILFVLRVPVTAAIGVSCILALLVGGYPLSQIPRFMTSGIESFVLLAVPFFILVGNLLNAGGATQRIFNFAEAVLGRIPGSLAQVNVGASMIFAGMSGAAIADAAGLGTIEIKAMRDAGYRPAFAAAVTLASAVIGPIIPPSIIMIIYAAATGTSAGRMFLAGVVPGVLIGLILMIYIFVLAKTGREQCPSIRAFSFQRIRSTAWQGSLALVAPLIIVGGMVSGAVTPTEAGVVAAFYALAIGFAYRGFTRANLWATFRESGLMAASIMYLIAVSAVMSWILTVEGSGHKLAAAIAAVTDNRILALLLMNLFLIGLGLILETAPAILITSTLLLPVAQSFGVDPVHFGIILCFNLLIGIITPPMGIGLYVIAGVARLRVEEVIRSSLPFLIPLLVALVVITYVPSLSLWLPNLVFGP
ncbi:MAG: TRAP transporter large permease, partial [Woeseiaceae bacterium]